MALNVGTQASLGAEVKLEFGGGGGGGGGGAGGGGGGGGGGDSKPVFSFSLGPMKLFETKFPVMSGCVAVGRSTATVTANASAAVGDVWVGRQTPAIVGPFYDSRVAYPIIERYFDMQVVVQLVVVGNATPIKPDLYFVEYTGCKGVFSKVFLLLIVDTRRIQYHHCKLSTKRLLSCRLLARCILFRLPR